jgi:predicted transcriptional regulator
MITGAQIRMARGYLRWSGKELADKAGVAESTIKRMEQDEGFPTARGSNIEAVYKTLVSAGIVLVPENGGGVGVRIRKAAEGDVVSAIGRRPILVAQSGGIGFPRD